MEKTAIVLRKRKKQYGSVSDNLIKISDEFNCHIRYMRDNLEKFDNIIFFDNSSRRINNAITSAKNANVAWWLGDYNSNPNPNLDKKVNYIFISSRALIGKYRKVYKRNVYYMPLCGHLFPNIKLRNINWNILFIGNITNGEFHKERAPYLKKLKKYGLKHIDGERTTVDMFHLYKNTPINLSISRYADGTTSNRLFNILASGGFALVRYFPGLEDLFENHKHLVWFKTIKEMDDLTDYYLKNPDKRKQIACEGYEIYSRKHTAIKRIKNMIDIMEDKTNKFYGYI